MKRFSDFSDENILVGQKVPINQLVDKEIIIHAFRVMKTKFSSSCAQIQFRLPDSDELKVTFSASSVLTRQLINYREHLPFLTILKRIESKKGHAFFTFS